MTSTRVALSRRVVLQNGLAGGLVLAFQWPLRAAPVNEPEQPPDRPDGQFAPNAFIRIDNTGKTTLVIPQAEMGQGIYTAIAQRLPQPTHNLSCERQPVHTFGPTVMRA